MAAEASSSLYAERLLEHWRATKQNIQAYGIGNKKMQALGFECLGFAEDLAVVGLQEVVSNFLKIYKVFQLLIKETKKRKPDLIILMDYPDFNFRLAKKLKKLRPQAKIVYYISPQVWAWRKGRVHFIKKYFDKMLVLFPFEVDFYKKYNIDVEFVGHPLLDELDPSLFQDDKISEIRGRYGISKEKLVLGLMPGSRVSELKHHLTTQIKAAELVFEKNKQIVVALLVAPTLTLEQVKAHLPPDVKMPLILVKRDPYEMVRLCDFVLCASGTATLTVGLMETPMAIMYKMSQLTVNVAKLIMKPPKFFGMANLILDEMVAQEFFQEQANPQKLAQYILDNFNDANRRTTQVMKLKKLKTKLGEGGVTKRVSRILETLMAKEH